MPSVYNYRHVELDKVGRGKRVIQPPGGQTADIFGRNAYQEQQQPYSSASSQAGSDVASSRVHIETDQQSIASSNQTPVDGIIKQQQQQQQQQMAGSSGQMSPTGSVGSSSTGITGTSSVSGGGGGQPLLMADDFKPLQDGLQQQRPMTAQSSIDASRTPKKTIPVLRRNPITGEIIENPVERPTVVRVRQPPGGRSSGIF